MMSTRFGTNIGMIRMVAKALYFLNHYLSTFMSTYQLLLKQLMLRKRQSGTARPLHICSCKSLISHLQPKVPRFFLNFA